MGNSKLFILFRKSGEPSFIKFLDELKVINVKKTTDTDRPKRQSNKQFNRRQKQTICGDEKVESVNTPVKSPEKSVKI